MATIEDELRALALVRAAVARDAETFNFLLSSEAMTPALVLALIGVSQTVLNYCFGDGALDLLDSWASVAVVPQDVS